jgi:uncharacterized integral membrane protein
MWIFRYFLPAIFAVALGFFVAQNFDQMSTIRFLFWSLYDVPLILIIFITLAAGIFVRYYIVFLKWLEKKQLEQAAHKIIASRRPDEDAKVKRDYSSDIEDVAKGRMKNRLEDDKQRVKDKNG